MCMGNFEILNVIKTMASPMFQTVLQFSSCEVLPLKEIKSLKKREQTGVRVLFRISFAFSGIRVAQEYKLSECVHPLLLPFS